MIKNTLNFLPKRNKGFTLVEVMVSAAIFVFAFTGIFLAYGQSVRLLDGLRQTSRAEDILLANVEFLRTRSWAQLTNMVTTSSSSSTSYYSSNMTESISSTSSNSPLCSTLVLMAADPLKIGLKNAQRDIQISPYPGSAATESMRKATVLLAWDSMNGRRQTNSMSVYVTKGGMTADVN